RSPRRSTLIHHTELDVPALDPTDEFLATCVRPAREWPSSALLWVVDAAMILRSAADSIDWDELIADATRAHAVLRLRHAVRRLSSVGAVLPDAFRVSLERLPITAREALAHRLAGDGSRRARRAAAYLVRSGDVSGVLVSVFQAIRRRSRA